VELFEALESEVRSYCRSFPVVFDRGMGCHLYDESGREYLDFFSGAGTLSYGHNNPLLKERLIEYLRGDGIAHSLDMATVAKRELLRRFSSTILEPRGLQYKIQFPGPTGTNAVEAALKLARKVTRRSHVLFFHNAYHGMTLGALAVTGNAAKRRGAGVPLPFSTPVPFDGGSAGQDSLNYLAGVLENTSSGVDLPAAVILETIQCEGGVNVASFPWLQSVAELLRYHGVLLIVDDIQVGCGRTGPFFSFEPAGIQPDIVCLSKAIGGFGLPMSLVLLKPELDLWAPGEHNGTFRGNNLAFVAGAEALAVYWQDDSFSREIVRKGELARIRLQEMAGRYPGLRPEVRGRGLVQGLRFERVELAGEISRAAFRRGLIIETAGPRDEVLKLLPPLIIDDAELERGLDIIESALAEAVAGLLPGERPVAMAAL
jgi:diaminobutyrate-2-oxoglutarate transaminase